MSEINFQIEVLSGGANISGGNPRILVHHEKPEEQKYPVGTIGSDIRDMLEKVKQGKREKIKIPKTFGNLNAVVKTYRIDDNGRIDFNGDGKKDALLLRTARIPEGDKKYVTTAWLVAIMDDDGDGRISPDEEKAGIVIASGLMAGGGVPITNIKTGDFNGDGLTDVSFSKYGQDGKKFQNARALATKEAVPHSAAEDHELILSALKYYDVVYQAPEAAWVKTFIRKEFKAETDAVENSKALAIPNVLRPLYTSIRNAKIEDERLRILAGIFLRDADQALAIEAGDLEERIRWITLLTSEFKALEDSFTWRGKKISRPAFEAMFRDEPDATVRLEMAKAYEAHFAPMYAEDGNYRKFIDGMNEMAKKYGYKNYAEMRIKDRFGITLAEFKQWAADTMKATEADAREYIDEIRKFAGENELGYWDVSYWNEEWIRNAGGIEKMPELTEEEAMKAIRAFFKDIGFDMEYRPYKNIVMDIYHDDMKFNSPGTAATATNDTAYFVSNIDPGKKIPLDRVETLVHELTHNMHYLAAAETLGGYSIYQNDGYSYVYEGLTMTTEDLPFATPALMKRYFGKVEGVTDKFAEGYGAAKKKSGAWDTRRLITMAMMEVNLYENPAPWGERLKVWEEMVRENLFVEPKGIKLGQIMCRSHPYSEQQQLAYASYPLGFATVKRIRDAIVKEGTLVELIRYGDALKEIMSKGGTADQKTLIEVVNEAEDEWL